MNSGSSLVFQDKIVTNNSQIFLHGGGTADIHNGFTTTNLFISTNGSTMNFYGNGGINRLIAENSATINLYTSHGGDFTLRNNNSAINIRYSGNVTPDGGTNSMRIDPSAGSTVTFGADIDGGGTGTFRRQIRFFQAGTVDDATIRFDATSGSVLEMTNELSDWNAAGTGSKVEITGAGIVRYSGTISNTSVTPILISTGTLELAKTDGATAIAGGTVTIGSTGTLRLGGSNQIANSTTMVFSGGTFNVGNHSDAVGALTVGLDGGLIDFGGESGSITFASLAAIDGTLTITGWGDGATIIFTDGSGWNSTTLALVDFQGFGPAGFNSETGELYAIPEPTTVASLLGLAVLAITLLRRRASRAQ